MSVELDDEPDPKCAPAVELEEFVLVPSHAVEPAEDSFSLVSDEEFSSALREQSIAEDHVQLADDAHEHNWEGQWEPGVNVGRWLRRGIAPIEEQTQVLVTNVLVSFSKLPKQALNSYATKQLQGVGAATLRNMIQRVRENSWIPVPCKGKEASQKRVEAFEAETRREKKAILMTQLREALFIASRGHADVEYCYGLQRLKLSQVDTGDKYNSVHFVSLVEQAAACFLTHLDAAELTGQLPSLGVMSPLTLIFDPVTLGSGMFSRHETLQVVMAYFLHPSTGQAVTRLIDARSIGMFHDGPSQAGDLLWEQIHPDIPAWVEWDKFHRAHCAFARVVDQTPIVQELYALGRSMSQQFGILSGKVLFRSIAAELNEPVKAVADSSGARKVYELSCVAHNLIDNFRLYIAGLHGKVRMKQAGHGKTSQSALSSIGRRLSSVEMVTFLCVFADTMACDLQPFVLCTERSEDPPWVAQRAFEDMLQSLGARSQLLHSLRRLLLVSCLLHSCLHSGSCKNGLTVQIVRI
ncbi:unnamed protein product [Symbiodinium sp. CCMP2456]|nr:unnamed protein product [Symbiodinium sp. CCMP2456]